MLITSSLLYCLIYSWWLPHMRKWTRKTDQIDLQLCFLKIFLFLYYYIFKGNFDDCFFPQYSLLLAKTVCQCSQHEALQEFQQRHVTQIRRSQFGGTSPKLLADPCEQSWRWWEIRGASEVGHWPLGAPRSVRDDVYRNEELLSLVSLVFCIFLRATVIYLILFHTLIY